MLRKWLLLPATLCLLLGCSQAQSQDFRTLTYFPTDSVDMELDLFLPDVDEPAPLVIYVHGGGFSGGDRTAGHKLAGFLAAKGIACASISYTLLMTGRGFGCDIPTADKVQAIRVAAAQTWEATGFLLSMASEIGVDSEKVFLAGSSAGAETVLHAAYWDREEMKLSDHGIPTDFRYAGVISGAGAIMDLNLITAENAIPVFAFHGNADPLVPYATAAHHFCSPDSPGWLMLFGSSSITDHVESLGGSAQLVTFDGGGHGHAGEYFFQKQERVADFIENVLTASSFVGREMRVGRP